MLDPETKRLIDTVRDIFFWLKAFSACKYLGNERFLPNVPQNEKTATIGGRNWMDT